MRLVERLRWIVAAFGGVLFMAVSTFPLLGGRAQWDVLCRGREFTGQLFDDCFNDQLLFFEILVPFLALIPLWLVLRYAFTLWAPDPADRTGRWRLASKSPMETWAPQFQIVGMVWVLWCLYRAALYPLDPVTLPFQATWIAFALWTVAGLTVSRPKRNG